MIEELWREEGRALMHCPMGHRAAQLAQPNHHAQEALVCDAQTEPPGTPSSASAACDGNVCPGVGPEIECGTWAHGVAEVAVGSGMVGKENIRVRAELFG
eukprot:2652733-Alexandrium_andersonii.AAC.1